MTTYKKQPYKKDRIEHKNLRAWFINAYVNQKVQRDKTFD